jgi:hypothetical protein
MLKKTAGIVGLALLPLQAFAEEPCGCPGNTLDWNASWYAGAAPSHTRFRDWRSADDGSYTSSSEDGADFGGRVFAGADFLDHFALELGYFDAGEATFRAQSDGSGSFWSAGPIDQSVSATAFDLSLLGRFPVTDRVLLEARVGLAAWKEDSRIAGTSQAFGPIDFRESSEGTDELFGGGVGYLLGPVRLTAEYTRTPFNAPIAQGNEHIDALSLSAAYLFQR